MIEKHLGETIDIHGGGRDLIFPHHENELAQSRCAHGGKEYVRYWMHNGYINIDGEKMSKSLGNFRMVRDLLTQYPGEVIRFALLSAHYRSELDFSPQLLDQSKASLDTLYGALRKVKDIEAAPINAVNSPVYQALLDDLNTSQAISGLHDLARRINKGEGAELALLKGELLATAELMGLLSQKPDIWFQGDAADTGIDATKVEALIAERQQAKLDKNYARADAIRQELKAMNVVLEDSKQGTTWKIEKD